MTGAADTLLSKSDPRQAHVPAAVDLYWLPLGAGAPSGSHLVRFNGKAYEAVCALIERRRPLDLYHAGLEVRLGDGLFVIEVAPTPDAQGDRRGVVAEGSVGSSFAGAFRLFRYEVRCWSGGIIADIDEAVASPIRVTAEPIIARRLLELVPEVPTPVWGRDELGAGDMWNSNSVVSWLITRAGVPVERIVLPPHGRAPGWDAGIVVARRDATSAHEGLTITSSRWRCALRQLASRSHAYAGRAILG
jgi:hypothetical protein